MDATPTRGALPHIDDATVDALLSMPEAITLMRTAFAALSAGRAVLPQRIAMPLPDRDARALVMPAYLPGAGIVCVKWVNVHHSNPRAGLPMIHGVILACDAATGVPLATLDAERLTAIRTGAGSGLATQLLATQDARCLAVFGTGAQAESQVAGVCVVRPIERLVVFGRDRARADAFAAAMAQRHALHAVVAPDLDALRAADVVCTATPSATPLFPANALRAGAHVNAVGAYRADLCEIGPDVLAQARIVVDQRSAAWVEAGDLVQARASGALAADVHVEELGELVDIVAPAPPATRCSVFKSVGNAVQDLVCVAAVLRAAGVTR